MTPTNATGKSTVLFLCKHNSARSQMAEAFLRRAAGDRFEVLSGGLVPTEIHPLTRQVMNEVGLDLSGHEAKGVMPFLRTCLAPTHAVIVCRSLEENCPKLFPGAVEVLRWPFDDPSEVMGSLEERLVAFRRVRDEIDTQIHQWLETKP